MIQAQDFVEAALARGYSFWTGVPCSFLTPFINYVIQSPGLTYIGATSEGEAVAIAAGAYLGGRKTVAICQNSGLGNMVNPLTSLNFPFRIPTLLIVTHRGAPGIHDEPQHEQMGRITPDLLQTLEIPWEPFPSAKEEVEAALGRADSAMSCSGRPYALLMPGEAVARHKLEGRDRRRFAGPCSPRGSFQDGKLERIPRAGAIRVIRDRATPEVALIATTGKIGRELFTWGHRPNQIYLVGSMGCASAVGLGLHESGGDRPIVVLDGDGAALMKMGNLATIGHYSPERLLHVILDNEAHESTGAQATVSNSIDFGLVAAACGYRGVWRADEEDALAASVDQALQAPGPNLIHVKVGIQTDRKLGRPTVTPPKVREDFMAWFAGGMAEGAAA